DSQEFTISVTPVNDAPSITGIPLTSVLENVSYEFTPESFDAEGSSLVFRIINIPGWAIFDTETGALTGIPTSEYIGITRGIIIAVSDGELEDALPPFDLSVIKVNDAPSADAQTVETDKNQEIDIILTATDPDGDSLNYTVDSAQLQGSLASMAPNLTYTPPSDFVGTDSFSFIADDGELASNSATVSIIVNSNSLAAFVTTKMTKKLKKGKYWIIETKITIKDEASNPLGSALIEGTWSDSKKGSVIKKTDKTGKATFKTYVKDKGKGKDQCFTITRVLKGQDYNLEGELGDCIPAEELTIGRKSKKKDSHTKDHKKKYPKTKKDKK
ncbi:MAG: Ig-like domain-containing protein, partial [bacterium]